MTTTRLILDLAVVLSSIEDIFSAGTAIRDGSGIVKNAVIAFGYRFLQVSVCGGFVVKQK
jgi:hypothetical protein